MSPRARWLERRRESLLQRALLAPLAPPAWVYAAAAAWHRRLYRSGLRAARQLSGQVLSVGNLTVGGTGKTPTAAWIAAGLQRRGRRVAIASRGYGGRPEEGVLVVSDGRRLHSRVERAGDEALLLAAHAPGVPVLVGRDRSLVGMRALSAFGADVLVLDDGFQHHRLARDLDVLTVDGALGFGNRRVLPRGPLREPLSALREAHAVAVVDGPLAPEDEELLVRWTPGAYRVRARRRPIGLRPIDGGPLRPTERLAGAKVGLLAGLARPAGLRHTVESLGATIVAQRDFADHHRYRARDVATLSPAVDLWVTTEKDALKILPHWLGATELQVLVVELEVEEPQRVLDWIETALR